MTSQSGLGKASLLFLMPSRPFLNQKERNTRMNIELVSKKYTYIFALDGEENPKKFNMNNLVKDVTNDQLASVTKALASIVDGSQVGINITDVSTGNIAE